MHRPFALALAFAAFTGTLTSSVRSSPSVTKGRCRESPELNGPCFTVRGRLSVGTAGPPLYSIWIIGTARVLGVEARDAEHCDMPDYLSRRVHPDSNTNIFATFVVCPFTDEHRGVMRRVCIDSAYHIRVRPRNKVGRCLTSA